MKTTNAKNMPEQPSQAQKITRRTFIKRTSTTVLGASLALHAFRDEAKADTPSYNAPFIENYTRANIKKITTSGPATANDILSAATTDIPLTSVTTAPGPLVPLNPKKLMTLPDVSINTNTNPWTYTYTFAPGVYQVQVAKNAGNN